MDIVRVNVALVPNSRVERKARALSAQVSKSEGLFVLDKTHRPHVTLYMSDYLPASVPLILKLLKQRLHTSGPVNLTAVSCDHKSDGYVEIRFARTRQLELLQKHIIDILNPLRKNIPAHTEAAASFSSKSRVNVKRYGYPAVGALYTPHITLTRLRSKRTAQSGTVEGFSFKTARLGLFITGAHGTAQKLLGTLSLTTDK